MKDEEMAEEYADEKCKDCYMCSYSEHKNPYKICQRRKDRKQAFLAGLKVGRQNEKVEYTLKKIIETVQNDNIDEYGARLVLIKDFAYECLEEIEK